MKLQDRVAIVTGCGRERGIGRAIALKLAKEGAHIVAGEYGRAMKEYPDAKFGQMEELESLVAEVRKLGRKCLPVKVDVTDEPEWPRWPRLRGRNSDASTFCATTPAAVSAAARSCSRPWIHGTRRSPST